MSELSSKDLSAVAHRWVEDYRRAPSLKQGWWLVRILERVLADRAEVERAAAEKALTEAASQMPFPIDPYGGFDHESLRAAFVQNTNWLRARAEPYRRNEGENE